MIPRDLRVRCDQCVQGLIPKGNAWPERCPFCAGRASVSLERVCRQIGENVSTVRKLLRPNRRMRAKVAYRILTNLDKWLRPKQPEMFR